MNKYRTRIYNHYVTAWDDASVPRSLAALKNLCPTMGCVIDACIPKDKGAAILNMSRGHGTQGHFAHQAGYANFDVIEHVTQEELIDLVDAVHLALKPTGCWIIHAPNASSPLVGAVRYGDYTHEQAFTPTAVQQLLKASGLNRLVFSECGPHVHGFKSLMRIVLWQLVRGMRSVANAAEVDAARGRISAPNFYAVAYKKLLRLMKL